MRAKLAFNVHKDENGELELIGYIDKNEIAWLCNKLRSLESNDHIHFHAGGTLFGRTHFPLSSRDRDTPVVEVQLSCVDPDDFVSSPFE